MDLRGILVLMGAALTCATCGFGAERRRVVIAPGDEVVGLGGSVRFTARAFDAEGREVFETPAWTVSGGGTIDGAGIFRASRTGGPFEVAARVAGAVGAARLTVRPAATPPAEGVRGWPRGFIERKDPEGRAYVLFVPNGYAEDRRAPLILSLHGAGERGDDPWFGISQGLAEPIRDFRLEGEISSLIAFPVCPKGSWWTRPDGIAIALRTVEDVARNYAVDRDRVTLNGLSMGAYGAYAIAGRWPDRWAGALICCGGGSHDLDASYFHVPFWIFHGEDDPVVPAALSRKHVEAMRAFGQGVEYTEYPREMRLGHDCWDYTYARAGGRLAFRWLEKRARVADPKRVVYAAPADDFEGAYWIRILERAGGEGFVDARIEGNEVAIAARGIRKLLLLLDEELVDVARPVRVLANGTLVCEGPVRWGEVAVTIP
ncbi:MAG: hypothetical protein JXP34_24610 [Planctomycetes bacterium]|nr:hypothetical protein [Planctomycetota bacterium]